MYISETRRQKEIQDLLKQYFLEQEEPTIRNVIEYIQVLDQKTDLDKPRCDPSIYSVTEHQEASAALQNNWSLTVQRDFESAYSNLEDNATASDEIFNAHYAQVKLLISRLIKDESRLSALITMCGLSDGYNKIFDELFDTLENVDMDNTTALVDCDSKCVTIQEVISQDLSGANISSMYTPKTDAVVTSSVLTLKDLLSVNNINDSVPYFILLNNSKPWLREIVMGSDKPVTVEIKIDLKEEVELTKFIFRKNFPSERGVAGLTCSYSKDGYEYFRLPTIADEFTITPTTVVNFKPTVLRYLKLFITKYHPDNLSEYATYSFYVGANLLSFYKTEYDSEAGNVFQSKPVFPVNESNTPLKITKVALETCETTDTNNSIDYYVSFDEGDTLLPISPYTQQNPIHPTSVSVASTLGSLTTGIKMPTQLNDYRYSGKSNKFNLPVCVSADGNLDLTGTIESELNIYRNIGTKGLHESNTRQDVDDSIEDALLANFCYKLDDKWIPKGWSFDGSMYSCIASLRQGLPLVVDFGPKEIIIDGVRTSGITTLSAGDHLIQIYPESFSRVFEIQSLDTPTELPGKYTDNVFDSVDDLVMTTKVNYSVPVFKNRDNRYFLDPLYPYNHRLIIEGVPYTDLYTNERPYKGVDLFAASKMKSTNQYDFENNIEDSDLSKFYLLLGAENKVGMNWQSIGFPIAKSAEDVIVDGVTDREEFAIYLKTYDENKYTADSVVLKAVLNSTNGQTPMLTGYRLKFGTIEE